MSRLQVRRLTEVPDHYCQGELYFDDQKIAVTLEPGHNRIPHPAIPAGTYNLILVKEGHVYADMCHSLLEHAVSAIEKATAQSFIANGVPSPQNVPGRQFIRIHIGNTEKDTEGCLLPGISPGEGKIYSSTAAYFKIYPVLLAYIKNDPNPTIQYIDIIK
jgi:hypothetical protein